MTLPAGESELRFEGVAGGIIPQTAIVTGLLFLLTVFVAPLALSVNVVVGKSAPWPT